MNLKGKKNKFDEDEWDVVVQTQTRKSADHVETQEAKDTELAPKKAPMRAPKKEASAMQKKRKKQFVGICVGCALFICLFVVTFILMAGKLNNTKVYGGLTLNGQSVSGLSRLELQEYIYTRYAKPLENAKVVLEIDAQRKEYNAQDFLILPDVNALTNEIYEIGHQGNIFSRLFTIYELQESPKDFVVSYKVKPEKLNEILALTDSQQYVGKIEPSYVIEDDHILFTYGRDGLEINDESLKDTFEAFEDQLRKTFSAGETLPGGTYTVKAEPKKTEFRRILKVNILNDLVLGSKDASFEKVSDKELKIIPEFVAKYVDQQALDELLARVNAGTEREEKQEVFELPDDLIIYTKEFYENVLFRDVLGAGSNLNVVDYGMGMEDASVARGENIALAVDALNGIILLPGESFSFRNVVSSINREDFVKAYEAYEGFEEKVLGGGISQVSSALFSAVCLTDLTVAESYHFDYVPTFGTLGFDAYMTVSGGEDLVFTNVYPFPIRIDASYTNRKISVQIQGTLYKAEDFEGLEEEEIPVVIQPEYVKEISAEVVSRVNYKTVEHEDPDMPEGSTSVYVTGITGYTVNLYLTTTVEDTESSRLISQVTYKVRDEQVRVGIGTEGA